MGEEKHFLVKDHLIKEWQLKGCCPDFKDMNASDCKHPHFSNEPHVHPNVMKKESVHLTKKHLLYVAGVFNSAEFLWCEPNLDVGSGVWVSAI